MFAEFHIRTETKSISKPPTKEPHINIHSRMFTFYIFLDLAGYQQSPFRVPDRLHFDGKKKNISGLHHD